MTSNRSLFVFFALIMLCCSGCSMVMLGYNNADWYLRYKITGYTNFNSEQKDLIHREVDSYLRWHRINALPQYTAFLQKLDVMIDHGNELTIADVTRLRGELLSLYVMTVTPMVTPASHLLNTLDEHQIDNLAHTFIDNDHQQKEKMLMGSEQEVLAIRAERDIDFIKELAGSLGPEQKAKITALSMSMPFSTRAYIEQREAKQSRLIALLHDKAGEEKIAALFWQWIDKPQIGRTAQQQQIITDYETALDEMTVKIFELLTTKQKEHLHQKLLTYIIDFKKLNSPSIAASNLH